MDTLALKTLFSLGSCRLTNLNFCFQTLPTNFQNLNLKLNHCFGLIIKVFVICTYLYEAPENGSNTILRGADKDSVPKYPIILLVHRPPFSLTLTMCMSHIGFFSLAIFFFHSSKKTKMCSLFLSHYFYNLVCTLYCFFPSETIFHLFCN